MPCPLAPRGAAWKSSPRAATPRRLGLHRAHLRRVHRYPCPTSVRAVEDALAIKIPENANSIRNIMQLNLQVHDHLVHFYHLHALDWVDVVSALGRPQGHLGAGARASRPGRFRPATSATSRTG